MDCTAIDLIAYHFGTDEGPARSAAEGHILGCTACLEAYVALRRSQEDRALGEVPRPEVRLRLRREVARTFGPKARRLAWLTRPIPLYQGLAAIGLVALFAVALPALAHRHDPLHEGARVDTSRRGPESLAIY